MKEDQKEKLIDELYDVYNKFFFHIKIAEKKGKIPKNNYVLPSYLIKYRSDI